MLRGSCRAMSTSLFMALKFMELTMIHRRANLERAPMVLVAFVLLFCVKTSNAFHGGNVTRDMVIPYQKEAYIINETVTVQVNAKLTIEPGVTLKFQESCGMVIRGALVANGKDSSHITLSSVDKQSRPGTFSSNWTATARLIGGNQFNEGRLEIFYKGYWGAVCDDNTWTDVNTFVACKELGFARGVLASKVRRQSETIWLKNVVCKLTDDSLLGCKHRLYTLHSYCGYYVVLTCSDFLKFQHWQGLHFTSRMNRGDSKTRSLTSSLVNVNVLYVGRQSAAFSGFEGAIVSNGIFPHVENVTLSYCSKAIVINNDNAENQTISLAGITISMCTTGIEVHHNPTLSEAQGNNNMASFWFERITITRCSKAIEISDYGNGDFQLHNIAIAKCSFGIYLKFLADLDRGLHKNSSFVHHYEKVTISECQRGILIYNWNSKDIRLNYITMFNCSKGVDVFDQKMEEKTYSCPSQSVYVTSPVEIRTSYWFMQSSESCSLNFNTRSGHVLYVYVNNMHGTGYLTIIDNKTSNYLCNAEVFNAGQHCKFVHSTENAISVQLKALRSSFPFVVFMYIVSRPGNETFHLDKVNVIKIQNVNISNSGTAALSIANRRSVNGGVVIQSCAFDGNTKSIFIRNSYLNLLIRNCSIKETQYHGLEIYDSTAILNVENVLIENSGFSGIIVRNSILNSTIKSTFMKGNSYGFQTNFETSVSLNIEKSTFTDHTAAMAIRTEHNAVYNVTLTIFKRNLQTILGEFYRYILGQEIVQLLFTNNIFIHNSNTLIRIRIWDSFSTSSVILRDNKFIDNNGSAGEGIIDIPIRGKLYITNNFFQNNSYTFLFQFTFLDLQNEASVRFINNSIESTRGILGNSQAQTVRISGCPPPDFLIQYNIFNNQLMDKEIWTDSSYCGTYNQRSIDARYNWWGTSDTREIKGKIFDSEVRNDRAHVQFLPVSTSRDFINFANTPNVFTNTSILSGYIEQPLRLTTENSPYVVKTDLTVTRNSNITIDPGVTLFFETQVGLLVLGNIFAVGTKDSPIKFCSLHTKCNTKRRKVHERGNLRLSSVYEGYLQIFEDNSWNLACGENFGPLNAKVACRELGFEDVERVSSAGYHKYRGPMLQKKIECLGNESSLLKCKWSHSHQCDYHNNYYVYLKCKPTGKKWGNIRITSFLELDGISKPSGTECSTLKNVQIDDAGFLHSNSVPSLQIFNRSPTIKHVKITNNYGNGIESVLQRSMTVFENVTVNGITIVGNRGYVILKSIHISNSKYGGLVIAPMMDIKLYSSFYGLSTLCDFSRKMLVENFSYLYIPDIVWPRQDCSKQISSPEYSTILIKFLTVSDDIDVSIYDGPTTSSNFIGNFNGYSDINSAYQTTSNSMFITAYQYDHIFVGILAEITIIKGSNYIQKHVQYMIESSYFHENIGPSISFTSDPQTISKLTITRNQITSSGNHRGEMKSSIEIFAENSDHIEISNNFIHNNAQGGIRISTNSSDTKCTIMNNVISSIMNGSEAILLQASNGSSPYAIIAGNELTFNQLNHSYDLLHVKEFRVDITRNIFFENFMRYVLNWDALNIGNSTGICENNSFSMNSGYLQTIVLKGSKKVMNRNFIVNRANHFEILVLPSYPVRNTNDQFDVRHNWLGFGLQESLWQRFRNHNSSFGFPVISYKPLLVDFMKIADRGFCPLGWVSIDNLCYFYNGGAQKFNKAFKICQNKGASLVKTNERNSREQDAVRQLLKMYSFKKSNITEIWTDVSNTIDETGCSTFNGDTITKNICDSLYPSICRKALENNCLNACWHKGMCKKRTCICNKGYEGEDCSQFHCGDVGNCGRHGTCVGPNYCRCRLGWKGRGCTISYCPPLTSCKSCLSRKGCGWCDERRRCLPGSAYRSDIGQCKYWFYYQCLSVGTNARCSNEIKVIDCNSKLCNYEFEESNLKTCQQCRDLGKCFKKPRNVQSRNSFCPTWNERRCPQGFVLKDYSDLSRIDNIVTSNKLKVITYEQEVLYGCPAEDVSIIVLKKGPLFIQAGQIISSRQAGGIFHKVRKVVYFEKYQLLQTEPASLNEAVSYCDFDQIVPQNNQKQLEDAPNQDLLTEFLHGNVKQNGSRIHTIGREVNIYKCVGNRYLIDVQEKNANTLYLVFHMYHFKTPIKVGDVFAGNHSNGFLETVTEVRSDEDKIFIHTELTRCADNIKISEIKSINKTLSSCLGGDGLLGLHIINGRINLLVGDIIVGRHSSSFLGKVVRISNDSKHVFAEISPITSQRNGKATTNFSFNSTIKSKRKRRENEEITNKKTLKFQENFKKSFKLEGTSQYIDVTGRVIFEPKAKVDLTVIDSTIKTVGVIFSGKAEFNVGASYNFGSVSNVSMGLRSKRFMVRKLLIDNKKIRNFELILQNGGFALGHVFLDVRLDIDLKVDTEAFGSISVDVSSSSDLTMGAKWKAGHSLLEHHFALGSTILSNSSMIHLEKGSASLSAVLTPTFKVQWPMKREKTSNLEQFLKGLYPSKPTKSQCHHPQELRLNVSFNTPIKAFLGSTICSEKCQDPSKNMERKFSSGLLALNGAFSLGLGNFQDQWQLDSTESFEKASSDCLTVFGKTPCCGTLLRPGKVNPKTKKCELICNCSASDPTKVGVLLQNGNCECEECPKGSKKCQCRDNDISSNKGQCRRRECPDGSSRYKRSQSKPECPCICADGSEREMTANGSCPCDCTCPDGSKDTVASDGSCPCICRCKGYGSSMISHFGCKCDDRCPLCLDDEVPVWVNGDCLCRVKYDCGLPPVCVDGRKGPKCLQPDCGMCEGCNRNGICTTSSSCESRCVCSWFWEGECCERRRPRMWWGDPHLETLDGIAFDYFGIGEFWNCKSVSNDFGMQTRFYAYKGVSLIGAVALKVGASIVSITTCSKCSSKDLPKLRIDGSYQSISTEGRFMLANETVTLDILNPGNNITNSNRTSLIVFAFQYKSGVTVSINVGYSPKMARQYINVQFTPIASFLRKTEGICGFMDDDSTNDLIGPNGEKYSDPIAFTDSWRVNTTTHHGSGMLGSWSWNSSNFHAEDFMDASYTDTNHKPIYTLDNFPKEIVETANATCMALGLENNLLRNCIFDISVTNDTSFLEQQTLKLGCPNECSGKGLCENATCSCLEGWSSEDCSVGKCGNCSRGKCEGGFCQCEVGWEGSACDHQATCYNVDNCTSPIYGKCLTTDKCLCNAGYIGLNCSIKATCYNVNNCSLHGVCIDVDACKCDIGWNGTTCDKLSCEELGYCSGNGRCIAFDVCQCRTGWTGPSCAIFDCTDVNQCSKNGQCVAPNKCNCFDGYQGVNCNASLNCSSLEDCSQNGVCVLNKELRSICRCYFGFSGSNCSEYDCSGAKNCSGRGKCVQPNLCECDEGFEGESCSNVTCEQLNRCSGHGSCIRFDECSCNHGWSGESCDIPNCDRLNNCSLRGTCIAPNRCECYSMYDGERCNETIQTNFNSPVFNESIYNATIMENVPRKHHVLTVFANDSDHGRNGKVRYALVDNSVQSYFIIGKENGRIYTIQEFDYETLLETSFTFRVSATDDGSPKRSAEVTVEINIQDENDNCPVFKRLPASYNVPLKSKPKLIIVTAEGQDADSGKNGQIEYEIVKETNPDQFFGIQKTNGKLFVDKTLQPGKYSLTVVARDLGDIPCFREIFLTVVVDAAILPTSSAQAKNITSTVLWTSTVTTVAVEPLRSTVMRMTTDLSSYAGVSSSILPTNTPITFKSVMIDVRLINRVFDERLRDLSSETYQNLKDELNSTLRRTFEVIIGFRRISSVVFKKGSVIAQMWVEFAGSNTKVNKEILQQAIINVTDSKGNIGQLTFDISFLGGSQGTTTGAPKDSKDELLLSTSTTIAFVVGGAVFFIIAVSVFTYCFCKAKKRESKRISHTCHENPAYDVGHPVELIDATSFRESISSQEKESEEPL